jgi:tetratricopeptide (TPR) repeat protein
MGQQRGNCRLKVLCADAAVKQICDVPDNQSFFFMVGAGISRPPIPAAAEMIAEWKKTSNLRTAPGDALDQYAAFFQDVYPSNRERQEYIRTKIRNQLLPLASYKLAKIIQQGKLTKIVLTTNFDTFIYKALDYLGSDPLLYDHPQTANDRFIFNRDEPQLLHVHGTYLFYDAANLKGQINNITRSMLTLLDRILAERSPIVVGYSGWPEDVFMTALKKRLESGVALPNNVYWFCYRQDDLTILPEWLRKHSDVCVVVPADMSGTTETYATFNRRNTDTVSAALALTLPATEVFDRFLKALQIPASDLDVDPVTFFVKRLKNVLSGLTDNVIQDVASFVKSRRQGYETLNNIKNYVSAGDYSAAGALACSLSDEIGTTYSDSDLAQELAEVTLQIALQSAGQSKDVFCLYKSVANVAQWLQKSGSTDPRVHALIARAWFAGGVGYLEQAEFEKAIAYFDLVIETFAHDSDVALLDPVTSSIVNKGIALCRWHHPSDDNEDAQAIQALYDSVINTYKGSSELALRESLVSAQVNKAYLLSMIGKEDEALALYNQVIDEHSEAVEPVIREHVARAMINKAFSYGARHTPEATRTSIRLYDELVTKFPIAWKPTMRAKLGLAWNGLAFQRLLLAKWQLRNAQDATATLQAALDAIKKAKEFDEKSWLIFGNEAYIRLLLGDREGARTTLALALQLGNEEARIAELSDTTVFPIPQDEEFKAWLNDTNAAAQASAR